MANTSRNKLIANGIERLSRSQVYAKKGIYKRKKNPIAPKPKVVPVVEEKPKPAEPTSRIAQIRKITDFYPGEDAPKPKAVRKTQRPTKLRASITPGTVLILLAGRFRGKRVVFLKQLESGLLLVSGPHKVNGVPLRRVNQAYVMATSTKVDVSQIKLENVHDQLFKKEKKTGQHQPTEEGMFGEESQEKKVVNSVYLSAQKEIDAALLAQVKKVPNLKAYLNARFTLTKGQAPHLLKF